MNMMSNAYFGLARCVDRRLTHLSIEQSLGDRIADRRIARRAFGSHTGQHRHVAVDIIIDDDLPLGVMKPVKTAGVLRQGSPARPALESPQGAPSLLAAAEATVGDAGGHGASSCSNGPSRRV